MLDSLENATATAASGEGRYCLHALECLVERAAAYEANNSPITWGWCRYVTT